MENECTRIPQMRLKRRYGGNFLSLLFFFCQFIFLLQNPVDAQKNKKNLRLSQQEIEMKQNEKNKICAFDVDHSSFAVNLIHVTKERYWVQHPKEPIEQTKKPPTTEKKPKKWVNYPRVLCFVNTVSTHRKRADAVFNTWGKRCDKLVFCSNETDASIGAVKIDAISDHNHLWQKHKATIRYIMEKYGDEYDWFYKSDDDAYVIMENLKKYLRSPEIANVQYQRPIQLGHRYSLTQKLINYYIVDGNLKRKFKNNWDRWIFNSGGPGYAMNKLYMQKALDSFDQWTCLSDRFSVMLPDDAAISFCMMWHNVFPHNTRDLEGRERWHADKPKGVYFTNPNQPNYWVIQYHERIGGYRWKDECCAPDSIAFHYILPAHMYYFERQFYYCPSSALDLESYNRNEGNDQDFSKGEKVLLSAEILIPRTLPPKNNYPKNN